MKYKVLGFSNPSGYVPNSLVTIAEGINNFYAIWPDCSFFEVRQTDIERVISDEDFIPCDAKRFIFEGEYSFIFPDKRIVINNHLNILLDVKDYLDNSDVSTKYHQFLNEYLEEGIENVDFWDVQNLPALQLLAEVNENLKILVTERKKSNSSLLGNRIIVQHNTQTGFKSSYRKNLNNYEDINNFDQREKVEDTVRNFLWKIFMKIGFSESDLLFFSEKIIKKNSYRK